LFIKNKIHEILNKISFTDYKSQSFQSPINPRSSIKFEYYPQSLAVFLQLCCRVGDAAIDIFRDAFSTTSASSSFLIAVISRAVSLRTLLKSLSRAPWRYLYSMPLPSRIRFYSLSLPSLRRYRRLIQVIYLVSLFLRVDRYHCPKSRFILLKRNLLSRVQNKLEGNRFAARRTRPALKYFSGFSKIYRSFAVI